MASAAKNVMYRQYAAIVHRWPVDPLRPNVSFQDTLARRVHDYFTPDAPIESVGVDPKKKEQESARPVFQFEEKKVQKELGALAALLEDRFKNAYPISDTILKPKSNPDYYDKLIRELDQAPRRSWLSTQLNKWKGWVRME